MALKLTTAYWLIKALTKKIRIVQGGQGASKTYSILSIILEQAIQSPIKATIVTETYPQLKDGVIADMKDICNNAGIDFDGNFNKSDKNLTIFNSEIQFRNVDNKDFHKSKGVRRDILFVNEGNRTSWQTVDQMLTRSKVTYVDYNPDAEFWVHEHLLHREDAELLILTYQHNEMLSDEERIEIESRRSNLQWWRIYGEGKLGIYSDRQIYKYDFVDNIPEDAKRINSGMDFGKSPDPTILVDLWIKDANLYCDEVFCENNLQEEKITGSERMSVVDKMNELKYPKGQLIIGDTSGKSTILDMRKHGYNIIAVKKNIPVIEGIGKVNSYKLHITKRSINVKKGIEKWHRKVDHNGKIIPEPDGHEPDGLAAIRYGIMFYRS